GFSFYGNGFGGGGGFSGGGAGEGGSSYLDTVIGTETVAISGENFYNGLVTLSLVSSSPPISGTPEPSTRLLFGTGVVLMGLMVVRKKKEIRNTA
nr:PEP-CTERM sorting domain-containing protein [Nitrospiraceae bacterium]